jgi:hypothetical protein
MFDILKVVSANAILSFAVLVTFGALAALREYLRFRLAVKKLEKGLS